MLHLALTNPSELAEALKDEDPQAFAAAADIETGWARQREEDDDG